MSSPENKRQGSVAKGPFSSLFPYLLLALLVLLFFNQMVFTDLILARGDTFLYFYPYWQMATDGIRSGEIPFWNPHIFMGAPFLANSQVGLFYPPNWLFWLAADPPQAVKLAIVSHQIIAICGMFRLASRRLSLSLPAALLSAIVFGLGGYLTAQVEHVNQLQGMAWLPWLLLMIIPTEVEGSGFNRASQGGNWFHPLRPLRKILAIALLFSLQILAGHTQTVFLSGAACGLWLLGQSLRPKQTLKDRLMPFGTLAAGALLALCLSAVQLYPTYELTQLSSRQGGLTTAEVLSFSWHPLLASQSLFPTVNQSVFTEYVAFVPVTALFLMVLMIPQIWQIWRTEKSLHPALIPIILVAFGLFLALGRFNFISWSYSRLPGLDLFRVPARWLILVAVGGSLLAGYGLDGLSRVQRKHLWWPAAIIGFLLIWNPISLWLSQFIPTGAESQVELLSVQSLILIVVEIGFICYLVFRSSSSSTKWAAVAVGCVVLFIASRGLPYNRLTTPEAYTDLRPAGLRLQADAQDQIVPDRFLSLSNIFFDPGDQAEIDTIYDGVLNEQALYDYTISIKLKEIVSPNFPMVYGLASLDGFDGGILPLKSYSNLMAGTILPEGQVTTDGRLREHLEAIPADEWLDKFNVRYVITDKVGDVWVNDVFFDRQHVVQLAPNTSLTVGHLPRFTADSVQILSEQPLSYILADGERANLVESADTPGLWLANLEQPANLQSLEIFTGEQPAAVTAISLVNAEEGWFKSVVPAAYRLIHSGDVKIYENLDVWPRAILVENKAESIKTASRAAGTAEITRYSGQAVHVQTTAADAQRLILTEAAYPGWTVSIDGVESNLILVDELLRAVDVPAGSHDVVFTYRPTSFRVGLIISAVTVLLMLGAWFISKKSAS